ncbi:WD40 repeat domain-containing serine/threonine protein kinase [Stackebrandtia nassauensis]|nr:serine/threonine-protein kinase [Stackebrandtia nassauensis]
MDELRPAQVGPYRLTASLGAGGMGEVFLGVSPDGGKVAVKLLNPDLADSAVYRERFAREIAAAKRVSGRHTVRVVDADPEAESPWLATEYVPGPTLHELVRDDGVLDAAALRQLGAALAEGLTAIHSHGLVHRDLKPGNVIMAADGPRIIDFGVAQAADASTLTGTGAVVGTYAFTSPEQIRADQSGPASDVFTLGSVLVFAATGRSPFDASTIPVIVHRILSQTPDLDGVPRDLRRLIGDCLAKDPAARPSPAVVASVLSGDLDATTLEATRVESRPVERPRGVSRRGLIVGGAGIVATAVVAVPTILLRWNSTADGTDSKPYATLSGHKGGIAAAIFSVDDKTIATGGADKSIRLWNVPNGEQVGKYTGHTDGVTSLCWDPEDQNLLISGGRDGTVRMWDLEGGLLEQVNEIGNHAVTGVAYDSSTNLASGLDNGEVRLWHNNASSGAQVLTGHTGRVTSVATTLLNTGGNNTPIAISAAAEGKDSALRIWNMDTGKRLAVLAGHTDDVLNVAASRDMGYVASASKDKTVRLWDPAAGSSVGILKGHSGPVYGVAFDNAQETLASGSVDGTVRLWKVSTGEHLTTLTGGPEHPSALAISGDGTTVIAGDRLWRLT